MTEAKFTKPVNRLSWRAGRKGVTRAEGVDRAEANLELVREATIEDIDDNIARLNAAFSDAAVSGAPPIAELYQTSGAIAAIAGVFGLDFLGKAAFSLCELLADFQDCGYWRPEPVKVHLDAMRIFRQCDSPAHEDENQKILKDIMRLVQYFTSKN